LVVGSREDVCSASKVYFAVRRHTANALQLLTALLSRCYFCFYLKLPFLLLPYAAAASAAAATADRFLKPPLLLLLLLPSAAISA
jgi:hypothetical protein